VRALEAAIAGGAPALDPFARERLVAMRALDLEVLLFRDPAHAPGIPGAAGRHAWAPSSGHRPTVSVASRSVSEDPFRRGVAEFLGAFTLIFIGGGAGIISHSDIVAVALANGLAIGIMVTNLGHISGGHFNPAITLGFVVTRRIKLALAAVYVFAQLLGAVCAAFLLRWLFGKLFVKLGSTPVPHTTDAKAYVLEAVMTLFLVWAVWATAVDPRGAFKAIAGLAIGLTITIDVFVGGPVTGAAMNPARAFGPELASDTWTGWWIYWIGPITGGLVAALVYEYLYLRPEEQPPVVGPADSGVEEPGPGKTEAAAT
jgi:aquaporin Z